MREKGKIELIRMKGPLNVSQKKGKPTQEGVSKLFEQNQESCT